MTDPSEAGRRIQKLEEKKEKLKKNQSHLETRNKLEEKELAAANVLEKQKQLETEVRLREMTLLEEEAKINSELMRLAGEIESDGAGFESRNETDPDFEQVEEFDGKEKGRCVFHSYNFGVWDIFYFQLS